MTQTKQELSRKQLEKLIIELRNAEVYYLNYIQCDINRLSERDLKDYKKDIRSKIKVYNQRDTFIVY